MQKNLFSPDIPADIPKAQEQEFIKNYAAITHNTGRLMLFAADQKMEHLNDDFYGTGIAPEANNPEHLFKVASQGRIGAFATHLGLIARYGKKYADVNYIVKINGKTNLIATQQQDPRNALLWSVNDVAAFKKNSGLNICGVGYTLYLGSEFESELLHQAAQAIFQAHQHGLIALLWIYPRGKAVKNERSGALLAGAAGLAASVGADFVKINPPDADTLTSAQWLAVAAQAAGRTKIICSGGKIIEQKKFLQELYEQLHTGNISGNATGRNIHSRSHAQAVAMTQAIAALTIDNKTVEEAFTYLV